MKISEQINELAAALSIAQGQIIPAIKDSENPQFRGSKYADLAAIWEVMREPLAKNGLSLPQFVESEGDCVIITTMLLHKSGQWMTSTLSLKPVKQDPQGYGSAATYGKRYGAAAMMGVVADIDDDGNAATFGGKKQTAKAKKERWVEIMKELDNVKSLDDLGFLWTSLKEELAMIKFEQEESYIKLQDRKDELKKLFNDQTIGE